MLAMLLQEMRVVLADGAVLDTADESSCTAFLQSHKGLIDGVSALAAHVQVHCWAKMYTLQGSPFAR